MKYRAVLFDLDGTLLDTLRDIASCGNAVLSQRGLPRHGLAAYKQFVGDGRDALVARSLPESLRDKATVAEVAAAFDREYERHWADSTHPYAGVPDLLRSLVSRGLRLAVVTNKPDEHAKLALSELLPEWHFDVILGARPGMPRKPDPAGALEAAREMKLAPADFIYLGDSGIDMRTARAAGMFPAGALWGFRGAEELLRAGAEELFDKPLDLLRLL